MKPKKKKLYDFNGGPMPGLECLSTGDCTPRLPVTNGLRKNERISDEDYQKYFELFNPDLFSLTEWAKKASMATSGNIEYYGSMFLTERKIT
jgi:hypothetical protein